MCVLLWGRDVRLYDTLDEAVQSAMWAMDSDNDWVDRIEVVGQPSEPSQIIEGHELYHLVSQREEQIAASLPVPKPHVANVFIDGTILHSFYGESGVAEAEQRVEQLRARLGDRVTMRAIQQGRYIDSR